MVMKKVFTASIYECCKFKKSKQDLVCPRFSQFGPLRVDCGTIHLSSTKFTYARSSNITAPQLFARLCLNWLDSAY